MAFKSPKMNPLKLNPWLIDELAKSVKTQDDLFGKGGVMKQLVKAIAERSLGAELGLHLGYEKHDSKGKNSGNSRNGTYPKTVSGEYGDIEIDVPRDREGSFEPLLIPKGERRFEGHRRKDCCPLCSWQQYPRHIRNSLRYVSWKDRKEVAADLRAIYTVAIIDEARLALDAVKAKWGKKYAMIGKSWEENWDQLIPFFGYPREIRTIIYTTNAIESANMCVRKVIKNKRSFPSDGAALKMIYLAMQNMSKKWKYGLRDWTAAVNFFVVKFEGRFAF